MKQLVLKISPIIKKLAEKRTLLFIWALIAIIAALAKMKPHAHNNYNIFRHVYYNTLNLQNLYLPSSDGSYDDLNHYGPFFSLIIAPFAICPTWLGLILWCLSLTLFLFWSISTSTLSIKQQCFVYIFCAHELLTALFMQQFNIAIAAIIILAYIFVEKGKDWYATFFIIIGTLVKLYGIVGLAFFPFSKHKYQYIASFLFWLAFLSLVPSTYSNFDYQLSQYIAWGQSLLEKNTENGTSLYQNISVYGMAHRISGKDFSDLWILLPAITLFALPYLRFKQWSCTNFRRNILASSLMFICLYSTGTESSGYIIALTGVAIWFCSSSWKRGIWDWSLLIFCFILSSMSPSDIFPKYLREHWVLPYALKALPVFAIWLQLTIELLLKSYYSDDYQLDKQK